ncbi:MAG: hypothetical protein ABSC19_05530 [Syntrophorhabdales bacterium]|jgi:hypothetical protein
MDGYDDDEKPSWREIDKRRDRSSHVSQERQGKENKRPGADRWNTGRHKLALEKLFMGDKGTLEHEKLYKKIHKSYGTPSFVDAVRKYVEKYGPPDDVSTMLLVLDSKDVPIMLLTMEKLQHVYIGVSAREKEDVRRKLSILSLTDKSAEIKERASDIGEQLKSLP